MPELLHLLIPQCVQPHKPVDTIATHKQAQWIMENCMAVLKISFLPSCAVGPVLSAFSDAREQPKTRRAKTRKTNFFRRLQVVMMPGLGRGEAGKRAPVYSARRGGGMEISCQRRARPAHGRRSSAAEGAPGCHHRERSCQKLLLPSQQMCAGAKGWKRRGGRHNPESSIGAPQRRRAAHVTEVEQTEWEDGGRKEKPMTISSVCHSQGSPCAPHTRLGPKA